MEYKYKIFPTGKIKPHYAILNWRYTFMNDLVNKFVFYPFSIKDAEDFFKYFISANAIRLRILRLYRNGRLVRALNGKSKIRPNRSIYLYEFSNRAKDHWRFNGSFDYGRES